MPIYLSVYSLSVCWLGSVRHSFCLCLCWPDYLLALLSVSWLCLSLCLCVSVSLTVCLSVCLTVCWSLCLLVWLSVCLYVCLSNIHSSACQADCTFISLSVYLPAYLSVQLRGVFLLLYLICPSLIFLVHSFIPAVRKITQTLWKQHTKLV